MGPACVKTSFKSELGPNLLDFIKFQFAKALISLKLKFQWPGQVHNSSSSPTFLHSLGQKPNSGNPCFKSAVLLIVDMWLKQGVRHGLGGETIKAPAS
jgi:hypothetical protein